MKFLVDVGVSKAVEEWLRSQDHDVIGVRDLDPRMLDSEILERAVLEHRIVITMDKDFGDLVYNSGRPHAGVLLLRLAEAGSGEKVAVMREIVQSHKDKLPGRFVVYQNGRLRIKKSKKNNFHSRLQFSE